MAKTKKTRRADTSREAHASDPVTAYARAVVAGSIVAGPHVRNACQRHLKDLKEGPKRGLRWDVDAAQRALGFFPDVLRLAGGQFEGLPFALQPSQQFIVGSLFGWKRKDGWRRFRRAYIEEGKGNGKSPLAAGIGLYGMMADGEDRAEVYAAASDRDQAMVLFRDAVAMVDQSPALDQRVTQSGENPVWQLTDLKTASFFKPLSREKRKKGSGPRPHFALENPPTLGRQADAPPDNAEGPFSGEVFALQPDLASRIRSHAEDRLQSAAFAGTVAADQGDGLGLLDVEGDTIGALDASVAHAQISYRKKCHGSFQDRPRSQADRTAPRSATRPPARGPGA
jgi:hypothetical protein